MPIEDRLMLNLCDALDIRKRGEGLGGNKVSEMISIVGGGGKSALLFALGDALGGKAVLTTTTRIFANQLRRAALSCSLSDADVDKFLADASLRPPAAGVLVVGEIEGEKARGVPLEWPGQILRTEGFDYVIIEADGSRMRPAKAPAAHEPVIPDETTVLVVVAGIDALKGPISETCHRPERVAALLGLEPNQRLLPDQLARLMSDPEGGMKSAPIGARICLLINKVESASQHEQAGAVALRALAEPRVDRVLVGALEPSGRAEIGPDDDAGANQAQWRVYQKSASSAPE
jgi:probable selenium-dependent hydroxylase accessory protein YqeC